MFRTATVMQFKIMIKMLPSDMHTDPGHKAQHKALTCMPVHNSFSQVATIPCLLLLQRLCDVCSRSLSKTYLLELCTIWQCGSPKGWAFTQSFKIGECFRVRIERCEHWALVRSCRKHHRVACKAVSAATFSWLALVPSSHAF